MEWLKRMLDGERPVTATCAEIAGAIAEVVQTNTNRLMTDLQGQGLSDERSRKLAFAVECLLFEAFPLDVIVAAEFGPYGNAIRERLADCFFEMATSKGLGRDHASEFERLRVARFQEYIDAMKNSGGGQGLERLSNAAWSHISGGEPGRLTCQFTLLTSATASFKFFQGIATRYEVTG